MVRYPITPAKLEAEIERTKPGWLADASNRTNRFRIAGKYDEKKGNWSAIKKVYMDLQANKCAFCEQELEDSKIQHDVEHFRPKRNAKGWPDAKTKAERGIAFDFPPGAEAPGGYFLLAYHPWNYLTSCKTCNSSLKSDFFPIFGDRVQGKAHPKDYKSEKPYLVYPLGKIDQDPERVFRFEGIFPAPIHKSGISRRRALVTISFFNLATRETLLRQRAKAITNFSRAYADWKSVSSSDTKMERGRKDVVRMTAITAPHANCVRSFRRLCDDDPHLANRVLDAVWDYLDSVEPVA